MPQAANQDALNSDLRFPDFRDQEMRQLAGIERRVLARYPVLRSARVRIGQAVCQGRGHDLGQDLGQEPGQGLGESVFDCLVLDESPTGVLVDFGTMIPLPEDVSVHFINGGSYLARRRWAAGTRAGLEFCGEQLISRDTADRMRKLAEILDAHGLPAALRTLRTARFYDQAALRTAAEEAEFAYLRFAALLSGAKSNAE
jgi:hypothetical protein